LTLNLETRSTAKVVIVDYGVGNHHSVKKAVDQIIENCVISSSVKDIENADKIILPGVGHFETAMSEIKRLGLVDPLNGAVLERRKPVLGICLGMELMAGRSEEGDAQGLGWLDAVAVKFRHLDKGRYKVPHMGWNQISTKNDSWLMKGIPDLSEFYFAHSYYLKVADGSSVVSETEYETVFPSAIERDNLFGVQFHPEKSHDVGRQILANFVQV
jgi:glutamine amidotransferase